jgi:hypothetical protein
MLYTWQRSEERRGAEVSQLRGDDGDGRFVLPLARGTYRLRPEAESRAIPSTPLI